MATLSTLISMVVGALFQQNSLSCSLVVEKPINFEEKDSKSVWLFCSAFHVWVKSNKQFY
jgi:hypothetical protein